MTVGGLNQTPPGRNPRYSAVWFLRRLVLGMAILVLSIGGFAWLLHAAIDDGPVEGNTLLDVISRLAGNF